MNVQLPIEAIEADRLLELAQRLVEARDRQDRPKMLGCLKKMLVLAWEPLPGPDRETFLGLLDLTTRDFAPLPPLSAADQRDAEMVHVMQRIERAVDHLPQKERDFLNMMMSKWRFPNFTPSEKQERYTRTLVERAEAIAKQPDIPDMEIIDTD